MIPSKICCVLLVVGCWARQFINTQITGTRDLDAETYENSFKRILMQQQSTLQNIQGQSSETPSLLNTTLTQLLAGKDKADSTNQAKAKSEFDSVDYAGDIASSLKSLLSPSSEIDRDLIKKLIEDTGVTDQEELTQQYQAAKTEERMGAEDQKQFQENLSEWVRQEKEKSSQVMKKVENEEIIFEGFSFYMKAEGTKKLYMTVPRGRPQNYLFSIDIYWQSGKEYVVPQNPSQSQTLNLSISHAGKVVESKKTYISNSFEWYQYLESGNIELRFDNLVGENILVIVNLQRLKTIADTIKDDKIDPLIEKLKQIVSSTQVRTMPKIFRGNVHSRFRQNEESLVSKLLIFTGLQSGAVIIVMMVQLYYLQKLIGNNIVMV